MTTWQAVELDQIARIDRSSIQPKKIQPGTLYLGLEHIEHGGKIIGSQSVENGELKSSKFQFSPDHLLYGKLRPYLAKIAAPDFEGICSTDIIPLLPGPDVDKRYLLHFLRQKRMVEFATSRASGANLPRLSPKELAKFKIPLPELGEQKRIAGILDAADALRAKRRETLAQLDTLLQSAFLEMFGDPDKQGWPVETVEDLALEQRNSIRTGPFGSQLLHSEFVDNGIPVLGIDNAVENEFRPGKSRFVMPAKYEKLKRYTVRPKDLLITIMGTCGRCAIVPDDIGVAINTKHLCCISLDQELCLPEYLHTYFLHHPMARRYLQDNAKGAIMSGLNMGIIKRLPVPAPPIAMQRRFAAIAQAIKQQKSRLRTHLDELNTLFASLQARAFAGEL
jgi:type I restriction enzyme S subunit